MLLSRSLYHFGGVGSNAVMSEDATSAVSVLDLLSARTAGGDGSARGRLCEPSEAIKFAGAGVVDVDRDSTGAIELA